MVTPRYRGHPQRVTCGPELGYTPFLPVTLSTRLLRATFGDLIYPLLFEDLEGTVTARRSPRTYNILAKRLETYYKFTDTAHGRTAPTYLRKHCSGCGLTLPNRSRSWVCADCYPEYRTELKRLAESSRRNRQRGGRPRWDRQ